MRHIAFDSVGGASGDMLFGALVGLGADAGRIEEVLRRAMPEEEFRIHTGTKSGYGMSGVKLDVEILRDSVDERGLHAIEHIIDSADMAPRAKELARTTFRRLAEAEGKVHGKSAHHVHFHEVGAVDSIVDILGSCMALVELGVDSISFGVLPEGRGTFQCRHGIYPIPAPATLELLAGCRIERTDEPFEMITPTGAALLTTWKRDESFSGTVKGSSVAFGTRELKARPNILRATLLESGSNTADSCTLLETNLDDLSPELLSNACEKLMAQGALDVWVVPAVMKKSRPGHLLNVLVKNGDAKRFSALIFAETGTFGIRIRKVERAILERTVESCVTEFGEIRFKTGFYDGKIVSFKPEYEDCKAAAERYGISLNELYRRLK